MDYARHRAEIQALITAKLKEAISHHTKLPNTPLQRALVECVKNLLADDELFPVSELVVLTHAATGTRILITERAKWNEERERLTEEGWREP